MIRWGELSAREERKSQTSVLACHPRSALRSQQRTPLVAGKTSSARQVPSSRAVNQPVGKIVCRHVGVPDIDQRFSDITETFNEQHERYECMKENLSTLRYRYRCPPDSSLSECLKKIMEEHDMHHIKIQIKGCYFSLDVMPVENMPDKLKLTQDGITELSRATTAVESSCTKLQRMIEFYLKDEECLTTRVREAAPTHQEQQRLEGNLQANLREARRAKEFSTRYREEARKLLTEAAQLSGVTL
ncbi:hypothetical protein P4O66_018879 [Electrophorus voltai]|uniref:Uncharacterized protein n=1 Tax=Electrophorus voltai TaxID=2609070 RepID=A0AAD8YSH1_9TELE|nr:hypothetical protein P4O66_018879 [Electrophorus voltai]